jgi:type IV pilus assembly protein PilA
MRNAKGFTLIELLIVVAIVAILAAVLIPNILNARSRALQAAAQSYARDILIALESIQSTFTQVDWRQTVFGNGSIQVVRSGALVTAVSGWRDGAGNSVDPSPVVNFEDFLKKPGQTGIVEAIVGKRTTTSGDVAYICVFQKVGDKYNVYSLYPDDNQFRATLNRPGIAYSDCP